MKILILGGAGMLGQKTARRLANTGLAGPGIDELLLHDIVDPAPLEAGFTVTRMTGNIADESEARRVAALRADVVFLLAAIVSGEAETDFDKGWSINGHGTWHLLEALRAEHDASNGSYVPRVVFSSSIAVFGGPFPDKIGDEFLCAPQTSYGAQKAMSELLVSDYSRKGMIDGISIRLPTVCVRPGKANLAASSFFSGIIREPLNGKEAILPVETSVRHWHASPRAAAKFMTDAAELDTSLLEGRRSLNMPGISCTVGEQIDALRQVAGKDVIKLIRHQPDEDIIRIVANWPRNFDPARATQLGFKAESSFEEIVRTYIEEDLPKS